MWPTKTPVNVAPPIEETNEKPPEKTPAELIAESLASALKPFAEKFEAFDKRFETLETQTKPREPKPVNENPHEPTSVLDDENLAFAQRLTPLMARQLELEARYTRDQVKGEYARDGFSDLWVKFEGDINKILDETALVNGQGAALRGDPAYIRNVVDMVFGRAARAAGMKFDGKAKNFFLETAGNSTDNRSVDTSDGLTEGQRKVMQRMGVPTDKAKDVIKKLHFVN